ncbi:RNA polymerase sigma factor [Sporosarcina soli]|uniref:RNA polymerase sigma factor n=1 Tax=Sporosarcina soli TaxID=334736 RepID=A0ABW0TRS1_9BACL
MGKNELVQQTIRENVSAFEGWIDRNASRIERLATQYGCTREQARDVTEEVFRSCYLDLHNQRDEELNPLTLFQKAVEKLDRMAREESLDTSFLSFEEDRQLHEKIIRLPRDLKLSFILAIFHEMDDKDIAFLLEISLETVKEAIDQAFLQLTEESDRLRLTKQLEFLNMSYGRMRPIFRKARIFEAEEPEIEEIIKKKTSKKRMIPWLVGLLILFALIVSSILTSEDYQKKAAEKYLERFKESLEDEMSTRYAKLGLPLSTEEDTQNTYLEFYGREAQMEFQNLTRRLEKELQDTGTINRKNAKEQYAAISETLAFPSEMLEKLVKNPLANDREQSERFIKEYMERYYDFQHAYQLLLSEYPTETEQAMVNGKMDLEQSTYPEKLQKAVKGMRAQNIYPTVIPQWNTIVPIFQKNEISEQMRASLHEDLGGYVTLLESTPFVNYPNLAYSYDESVEYLLDMEKSLLASWEDENFHYMLEYSYKELLYTLIGGYEPNLIYGQDGTVKEEVRAAWRKIASNGGSSPSAIILQKIIREMEANGWTESESRRRVTMYHISHAILLAREGQLKKFELTGIISIGQDTDIVSLPDEQFEQLVEDTYERFSAEHDREILSDVHPIVIFLMFIMANNHEDIETMEQLFGTLYGSLTFEEYINGWKQVHIDLSQFDHVQFSKSEDDSGSIWLETDRSTSAGAMMIKNQDHIWLVQHFYYDAPIFE